MYPVSLQTRAFAAVAEHQDRPRIARNVEWLERAQIKDGDLNVWPGSWSYTLTKDRSGDKSNTFYALIGLHAAAEAGVPVKSQGWTLAGLHWSLSQRRDGSWAYTPDAKIPSSSITCEGIVSLIMTRTRRAEGQEFRAGDGFNDCRACG